MKTDIPGCVLSFELDLSLLMSSGRDFHKVAVATPAYSRAKEGISEARSRSAVLALGIRNSLALSNFHHIDHLCPSMDCCATW
jgi:hypothetical protein